MFSISHGKPYLRIASTVTQALVTSNTHTEKKQWKSQLLYPSVDVFSDFAKNPVFSAFEMMKDQPGYWRGS
jgi:hypothetical protein